MKGVLKWGFLWFFGFGISQNLVKNPSFEAYSNCPDQLGTFDGDVDIWTTPTGGTTDYFNGCSSTMGIPKNFNGQQLPKEGRAYAGLYYYAPTDYREYIQAELKFTLKKGQEYQLTFYASLAESSDYALKDFGVVLSDRKLAINSKTALSKSQLYRSGAKFHYIEVGQQGFHEGKSDWFKLTTTFVSAGHERYLSLGNLRDNKSTRKKQLKRRQTKKGAYYYIDAVSLTKMGGTAKLDDTFQKDSLYVFKNVLFGFDKFTLTAKAKKELDVIHGVLTENPELVLEIHGHTDNVGNIAYNKGLSENRAKAIAEYFIKKGITNDRILWFGHGSAIPVVGNVNGTNRSLNRRVEFLLR